MGAAGYACCCCAAWSCEPPACPCPCCCTPCCTPCCSSACCAWSSSCASGMVTEVGLPGCGRSSFSSSVTADWVSNFFWNSSSDIPLPAHQARKQWVRSSPATGNAAPSACMLRPTSCMALTQQLRGPDLQVLLHRPVWQKRPARGNGQCSCLPGLCRAPSFSIPCGKPAFPPQDVLQEPHDAVHWYLRAVQQRVAALQHLLHAHQHIAFLLDDPVPLPSTHPLDDLVLDPLQM